MTVTVKHAKKEAYGAQIHEQQCCFPSASSLHARPPYYHVYHSTTCTAIHYI